MITNDSPKLSCLRSRFNTLQTAVSPYYSPGADVPQRRRAKDSRVPMATVAPRDLFWSCGEAQVSKSLPGLVTRGALKERGEPKPTNSRKIRPCNEMPWFRGLPLLSPDSPDWENSAVLLEQLNRILL